VSNVTILSGPPAHSTLLSLLPLMTSLSVAQTDVTELVCPVSVALSSTELRSHTLLKCEFELVSAQHCHPASTHSTVLSLLPLMMCSAVTQTDVTKWVCPVSVALSSPDSRSHTLLKWELECVSIV
jgi:hypothetical protein